MRCDRFKGDDVDALADTEDISLICGVPEGRCVAEVGLRGEQEREGNVSRGWGIADQEGGFVVGGDCCSELAGGRFEFLELLPFPAGLIGLLWRDLAR